MLLKKSNIITIASVVFLTLVTACTNPPARVGESIVTAAVDNTVVAQEENRYLLPDGKIAGANSTLIQSEFTVEKIDQKTRKLTLNSAQSKSLELVAGPEIRNFKQIKVGDKVSIEYFVTLAFEVRQPTAEEKAAAGNSIDIAARASLGEMPAGGAASASVNIATVEAINKNAKTITLKGLASGSSITVKAKYPENLSYVKVGDSVVITTMEVFSTEVIRVQ